MSEQLIRFMLTDEHLTLLRNMKVGWSDEEFGAPEIDPKRPYGNSDVTRDIAEILGAPLAENPDLVLHQERLEALHRETETALQVVLITGAFAAGEYEADKYRRNWRKSDPQ